MFVAFAFLANDRLHNVSLYLCGRNVIELHPTIALVAYYVVTFVTTVASKGPCFDG